MKIGNNTIFHHVILWLIFRLTSKLLSFYLFLHENENMKKIIYFIICYSLLTSCSNSDNETKINSEEVGEWKIVEVFSDIGNGTGSYNPVEQNKFIVFKANGLVTSNIDYCNTNTTNDLIKIGTFNPNTKQIKPLENACLLTDYPIDYEIVNNQLILTYQSIETYKEKYEFIVFN